MRLPGGWCGRAAGMRQQWYWSELAPRLPTRPPPLGRSRRPAIGRPESQRPHAPRPPLLPQRPTLQEATPFPADPCPRSIPGYCHLWSQVLQKLACFKSPRQPLPSAQSCRMEFLPSSYHKLTLVCLHWSTPCSSKDNSLVAPGKGHQNVSAC